ncbi:MAG: hypothetical protein ACI30R_06370 [Sodaliphilus sp.]
MIKLFYFILLALVIGLFSCSRNGDSQKDLHKLTDEIVLDSISVDDFEKLLSKAVSENDTADIQKLLGLAQSTYQKLRIKNASEADSYASRIKSIILNEPFLDNLLTNKENFFFKFNNDDFEQEEDNQDEEEEREEVDSVAEETTTHPDVLNNEPTDNPVETPQVNDPTKSEHKSHSSANAVPPPPNARVKKSFEKPTNN